MQFPAKSEVAHPDTRFWVKHCNREGNISWKHAFTRATNSVNTKNTRNLRIGFRSDESFQLLQKVPFRRRFLVKEFKFSTRPNCKLSSRNSQTSLAYSECAIVGLQRRPRQPSIHISCLVVSEKSTCSSESPPAKAQLEPIYRN